MKLRDKPIWTRQELLRARGRKQGGCPVAGDQDGAQPRQLAKGSTEVLDAAGGRELQGMPQKDTPRNRVRDELQRGGWRELGDLRACG